MLKIHNWEDECKRLKEKVKTMQKKEGEGKKEEKKENRRRGKNDKKAKEDHKEVKGNKICPFMSNGDEKVPCSEECRLYRKGKRESQFVCPFVEVSNISYNVATIMNR